MELIGRINFPGSNAGQVPNSIPDRNESSLGTGGRRQFDWT